MSYDSSIKQGRKRVAEFHRLTGVPCTIQGPTWNPTKKLYGPPYIVRDTGVYASIRSLASLRDPDVYSKVQELNISYNAYRQITIPHSDTAPVRDDRIVKEPVSATSDVYQVIEAIAPDETTPMAWLLHCQKV